MAVRHYPKAGEILLCDFRGYERPEMVKVRPVVVLVERLIGRSIDLFTIVPLGGERSDRDFPYQVPILLERPLSPKFSKTGVWAKCDMIAVVSRERLDRFHIRPSSKDGTHRWLTGQVTRTQLEAIKVGVLRSLGYRLDNRRISS